MRIHEVIGHEIIVHCKEAIFKGKDGIDRMHFDNGDGLRITPKSMSFELGCCRCGLSHTIIIIHQGDSMILRFIDGDKDYRDYIGKYEEVEDGN